MGAIWWRTRGRVPFTFSDGGDIICHAPHIFLIGFVIVFGEVSKPNVRFVTFCGKSFSC